MMNPKMPFNNNCNQNQLIAKLVSEGFVSSPKNNNIFCRITEVPNKNSVIDVVNTVSGQKFYTTCPPDPNGVYCGELAFQLMDIAANMTEFISEQPIQVSVRHNPTPDYGRIPSAPYQLNNNYTQNYGQLPNVATLRSEGFMPSKYNNVLSRISQAPDRNIIVDVINIASTQKFFSVCPPDMYNSYYDKVEDQLSFTASNNMQFISEKPIQVQFNMPNTSNDIPNHSYGFNYGQLPNCAGGEFCFDYGQLPNCVIGEEFCKDKYQLPYNKTQRIEWLNMSDSPFYPYNHIREDEFPGLIDIGVANPESGVDVNLCPIQTNKENFAKFWTDHPNMRDQNTMIDHMASSLQSYMPCKYILNEYQTRPALYQRIDHTPVHPIGVDPNNTVLNYSNSVPVSNMQDMMNIQALFNYYYTHSDQFDMENAACIAANYCYQRDIATMRMLDNNPQNPFQYVPRTPTQRECYTDEEMAVIKDAIPELQSLQTTDCETVDKAVKEEFKKAIQQIGETTGTTFLSLEQLKQLYPNIEEDYRKLCLSDKLTHDVYLARMNNPDLYLVGLNGFYRGYLDAQEYIKRIQQRIYGGPAPF